MGKFILVVIGIALFVYALFDLIATPRDRVRYIPKPLWFVVLLIVGIGPVLWLLLGRKRQLPGLGKPAAPKPRKPRGPMGPDDDPDYLRGL
ncbi:PLD nuclease N-terminal domain-containing protein [Aeromicrobium sp.]|uniref:PLD nuclease N-terminal domain-containing protein n=1 Tax=Aeromicrobium sp. TaxID=1871063 RepID=UPI003C5149D5